jgi:hypothetical protein
MTDRPMSSEELPPPEIIAMAAKIADWFAERNITEWKLGNVQSREQTTPDEDAARWRYFRDEMDMTDALHMIADGTDEYDNTIDHRLRGYY